jgi:hypothetical protein
MRAKTRREPQRVGSILEKALKKMSLDGKLKQHEAMNVWNSVVGEHVSRHAQPEFIRNKILFVRATSPPWMQQLSYMSRGIIEALNEKVGMPIVEEIRFKLGEVDPQGKAIPTDSRSSHPTPSFEKHITKKIEKTLSPIRDRETREILGRVILKGMHRRKGKDR